MGEKSFHIAMYPWFAMGHLTPYIQLANKLAERGHRISFLLPTKTLAKFEPLNLYPSQISLIPITIPHVDGLPPGAEITSDVPSHLVPLLSDACDLTKPLIESHLQNLKPQFVFFDSVHWLPAIARELNIKSIFYCVVSPHSISYFSSFEGNSQILEKTALEADVLPETALGFLDTSLFKLRALEARELAAVLSRKLGSGMTLKERICWFLSECDAIGFKACREMEGPYCHFPEKKFGKPVILAGPVIPKFPSSVLEERVARILDRFEAGRLVFVCLGSEYVLAKDQLEELVLGLELTGLPFLAALKAPSGFETIESALPEGFQERVRGKGFVIEGWIQQFLILNHLSVGCFVTHCGAGSISEGLVSKCQIVFLPLHMPDNVISARHMSSDLRVGVELEKGDEYGLFTRDGVCKAVKTVMDSDSEVGKEVRKNHEKCREFLLSESLESSYIDGFEHRLHDL